MTSRLAHVQERLVEVGTDLLALPPGSNLRWLTGADLHADERACLLLITPDDAVFLMPALEGDPCRASIDLPFETWTDAEGSGAALARIMQRFEIVSAARIDLDGAMRADRALMLLDTVPGARHGFAGSTIGQLRMIKSRSDYAALKRSASVADAVLVSLAKTLTVGVRECDVADMIRDAFESHSAQPKFAIVGAGENGAIPHHEGSDRRIKDGDVLVVDIEGRVDGIPSDISRSFVIGSRLMTIWRSIPL